MKDIRIEISSVGPVNGAELGIDADLLEKGPVAKRSKYPFERNQLHDIDGTLRSIIKAEVKLIVIHRSDFDDIGEHSFKPRAQSSSGAPVYETYSNLQHYRLMDCDAIDAKERYN